MGCVHAGSVGTHGDMNVPAALVAGLLSGGAIATQFGAVSALLLETAVVAGPRRGAAAGLGVASVDFAYATLALGAGAGARVVLAGHEPELKAAAALALTFIAVRGLRSIGRDPARPRAAASEPKVRATRRSLPGSDQYLRFVALTAINPLTIVYFASVATSVSLAGVLSRFAFVIGVGCASAIWHLSLTLAAGHAGRRVTPPIQRAMSIVGRLVVLAIAIRLALAA
jgi:threonine/homoserine/homoserine lactone efflux protein